MQEAERARAALLSVLEDRREAQDRLSATRGRFRGMLEQNIAAIFMVEDGRITFANRRAGEILGHDPRDLMGRALLGFVARADRRKLLATVRRLRDGGEKAIEETFGALRRDGTVAEILVTAGAPIDAKDLLIVFG